MNNVNAIARSPAELSVTDRTKLSGRSLMLIIIAGLGCFFVFFLVFDVQRLTFLPMSDEMRHPWERWELAALLWTFSFTFVYFFDFPYIPNRSLANKIISLLSLVPVVLTIPAAYYLLEQEFLRHFCLVLSLAVLLLTTDGLLYHLHDDRDIKLQYLETTMLADIPMVFALAVLGIYLWIYGRQLQESPDVFLAGAIAFQLVASNAIFLLIQSRVVHKVRERLTTEIDR